MDQLRVWVFPVLLGTGKRLFADGTIPRQLRLLETRASGTGVILQVYQFEGSLDYGSFALEQPSSAELERRAKIVGGQ